MLPLVHTMRADALGSALEAVGLHDLAMDVELSAAMGPDWERRDYPTNLKRVHEALDARVRRSNDRGEGSFLRTAKSALKEAQRFKIHASSRR
jgi:hypothetical protein